MLFAWDVLARKVIHADDVVERDRPYQCPNPRCRVPVYAAWGKVKDPYFAHYPGIGKLDCDEYHPFGAGGTYSYQAFKPTSRTEQQANRFAELELSLSGKGLTNWFLHLKLPPSNQERGYLKVRLAKDEIRKVPLINIYDRPRRYAVALGDHPIGVIQTSSDVRPQYAERVQQSETSLNLAGVTTFQGTSSGRYHPRAAKLFWGSSYFFVYKLAAPVTIPSALAPRLLSKHDNWVCSEVTLPVTENDQIASWLNLFAQIEPHPLRALISVLYPAIRRIDNAGVTHLPKSSELLIAVHQRTIAADSDRELWLETEAGHKVIKLPQTPDQLLSIPLTSGDNHFYVRYADDPGVVFLLGARPDPNLAPSIKIGVENKKSKRTASSSLLSTDCEQLLKDVRHKRADLGSLTAPYGITGRLLWRHNAFEPWVSRGLTVSPETSDEAIELLRNVLDNHALEVAIDFGSLGYHRLRRLRPKQIVVSLQSTTRRMLVWLLSQYADGRRALAVAAVDSELIAVLRLLPLKRAHFIHYRYVVYDWSRIAARAFT